MFNNLIRISACFTCQNSEFYYSCDWIMNIMTFFSGVNTANLIFGDMLKTIMRGSQEIGNCAEADRIAELWYDTKIFAYSIILFTHRFYSELVWCELNEFIQKNSLLIQFCRRIIGRKIGKSWNGKFMSLTNILSAPDKSN